VNLTDLLKKVTHSKDAEIAELKAKIALLESK